MSEQQPSMPEKSVPSELESAIQSCYNNVDAAFEMHGDYIGRLAFGELPLGIETLILTGPEQERVRLVRVIRVPGNPVDRRRVEVTPFQDDICTTYTLLSSGKGTQHVAWDSDVFERVGSTEEVYDAILLGRLTPEEVADFYAKVKRWLAECAALVQAANFAEGVGLQAQPIESAEEMRALAALLGACLPVKRQ